MEDMMSVIQSETVKPLIAPVENRTAEQSVNIYTVCAAVSESFIMVASSVPLSVSFSLYYEPDLI